MSVNPDVVDAAHGHADSVTVHVNSQSVQLPKAELTGLEIKQAAIQQGVDIQENFQLSIRRGSHYEVIGDADPVKIHQGQEFLAVAPDDNS